MKRNVTFVLLCLILTASAFAQPQTTPWQETAVSILVDVSKSIPEKDLDQAKTMIERISDNFSSQGPVSIYIFGNEFRKVTLDELKDVKISAGNTLLFDSAYDVAQDLQKQSARRKAILIFSDGQDTISATILEDLAHFATTNNIVIYGIGMGKPNRKIMERIAKLTRGNYYEIGGDVPSQVDSAIPTQSAIEPPAPPPAPAPALQATPQPSAPTTAPIHKNPTPVVAIPTPPLSFPNRLWWIGGIGAGALVLILVMVALFGRSRQEERTCPTCGKPLQPYQTICLDCSVSQTRQSEIPEPEPDSPRVGETMIITAAEAEEEAREDDSMIPLEALLKKPMGEEDLMKTFVVMESPVLVVRKGKNLGQTYALNRVKTISIGRSRVCEIRLDDLTVSSQHCRIIPESERHILYDLGSTNGTLVNGKKVQKQTLQDGDVIKVGHTQFLYKVEQHPSKVESPLN